MRRLILALLLAVASTSCAQFADDPFGWSPPGLIPASGGGGVPYEPKRLYWYHVGVGGGGWLHSGAFHPTHPEWVAVGADISGAYISSDGGYTWSSMNNGLTDSGVFDESHYVSWIVGVDADGFSGFIATTFGGIFKLPLGASSWQCMTPHDSAQQDYVYKWYRTWAPNGIGMSIPYTGVAWDGSGLLVAGGGKSRWKRNYFTEYYPNDAGVVSGSAPQATVWRCDLNGDAIWRPTSLGNEGSCTGISVAEVAGDTLVVFATEKGIYLGRNFSELYDLSGRAVRFNGVKTSFHFTQDSEAMSGHMPWNPHITPRGDVYVVIDYGGSSYTAASGVYKMSNWDDPSSEWVWVGNSDNITEWTNFFGRVFESHTATYSASHGTWPVGRMVHMSVLDGSGSAPDTLFVGDRGSSLGLVRILSYHGGAPESESWEPIFYGSVWPGYTNVELGWFSMWGCQVIFPPILHSADHMIVQPNGRLQLLANGSWVNVFSDSHGQPAADYWKTTGYSELSVLDVDEVPGVGILWCNADVGPMLTYGEDYRWSKWIRPATITADSSTNDASVYRVESPAAAVVDDFNGTGRWVAAICYGDNERSGYRGKVLSYGDIDGDGTPEFRNMCGDIAHPYNYGFTQITSAGSDFYCLYHQMDESLTSIVDAGMMRFWWDGSVWHSAKVNSGLTAEALGWIWHDLVYNAPSNRIFTAAGYNGSGDYHGAIWYYEVGAGTWHAATYVGSDFSCLAQTPGGRRIYAGTRGMASGIGTIERCDDPTASPPVFAALFNEVAGDTPFQHGQPFEYEYSSDLRANQALTNITSLVVDPSDTTQVWIGALGDDDNYCYIAPETLWLMRDTGTNQQLEPVHFNGERMRNAKMIVTQSHRLVVATGGNDLWCTSLDSVRIAW